jgi:hypothetical protein
MPIDRANKPYDPQDRRRREIDGSPMPTHTDHDDGPFSARLMRPPPKPGVPLAVLAWTVFFASITFATIVAFVIAYWPT